MEPTTPCTVTLTVREWLDISEMLIKSVLDIRREVEKSQDERYYNHALGIGTEITDMLDKIVCALEVTNKKG